MTDKDIIKYFNRLYIKLLDVKYDLKITKKEFLALNEVHNLITRQQAEIDKLKTELKAMRGAANSLKMHYEEAQAEIDSLKIFRGYAKKRASDYRTMRDKYLNAKFEAFKEFAERLKTQINDKYTECDETPYPRATISDIDNLVKEMAGD